MRGSARTHLVPITQREEADVMVYNERVRRALRQVRGSTHDGVSVSY